jgi:transcriptional regulator with XRE-family HTH domain
VKKNKKNHNHAFEALGIYLQKSRMECGLTQAEVGKILDYSPQFVANWERGVSSPPALILPKLIRILRIPEEEILEFLFAQSKSYWEHVVRPTKTRPRKRA